MIGENRLDEAYNLLINQRGGVGPKIARFVIRELAFSLTEWGKNEELDPSIFEDAKVLSYAVPIDRWVRRISLSIPAIASKLMNNLEVSDLADDNINDKVDEKLGLTIAELCYEMKLNPLRFDFGAYLFGWQKIKRFVDIKKIYQKLIKTFA